MIHRQEKLEKKFSPSQLQYLLNDSCNKCCGLPGHPTIGRAAAEHEKDLPLASRRRREHLKNRVVHGPQEFSKQKLGGLTPFFRSFQVESTDGWNILSLGLSWLFGRNPFQATGKIMAWACLSYPKRRTEKEKTRLWWHTNHQAAVILMHWVSNASLLHSSHADAWVNYFLSHSYALNRSVKTRGIILSTPASDQICVCRCLYWGRGLWIPHVPSRSLTYVDWFVASNSSSEACMLPSAKFYLQPRIV